MTAVLDDVAPELGEGASDVLEQARAVPGLQRDRDPERARGRVVGVPADRGEALGVAPQRLDVGAVVAVNGDPAPQRDVADDRVAGYGRAALREPHEHVLV